MSSIRSSAQEDNHAIAPPPPQVPQGNGTVEVLGSTDCILQHSCHEYMVGGVHYILLRTPSETHNECRNKRVAAVIAAATL